MTSEKIKHRDYILNRYINAGGKVQESDYFVFGYNNKAEFSFKLAALERNGIIEYQFIERIYNTCVVYEYFYAIPGKGIPTIKYSSKIRKVKFDENNKHKIRPDARYLRRMSVKRSIARKMQLPNLSDILGLDKTLHWVRGTFRGNPCSDINIITTLPIKYNK